LVACSYCYYAVIASNTSSTVSSIIKTRSYPAFPLFSAASDKRPHNGVVQVHVDHANSQDAVWVRFDVNNAPEITNDFTVKQLPSALFDTRDNKQTITALTLQASFPSNALIHFTLASSSDLIQWTPVALKGPLFHFDGVDAPSNRTLELTQPLRLANQYLRLSWDAHSAVHIDAFTGILATVAIAPPRERVRLPYHVICGAIGWRTYFRGRCI